MQLQGSGFNLQGGTGIAQPSSTPIYTQPINVQPATGVDQYSSVYTAPQTLGATTTATSAPTAPAWTDPTGQGLTQSQYTNLVNNFNSQLTGIENSANLSGQNYALGQKNQIGTNIHGWTNAQNDLNEQSIQNALAKQSGMRGIMDWVGQGIRSGGVMLANKNASNSSAADALARAYGQLGRQQAAGVNQQFTNAQAQVTNNQKKLADEIQLNIDQLPTWKQMTVNSIVNDANLRLGQLDQAMAYENLPNRVDMEAEKQKITADVLSQLQDLDAALAQANNINPASAQDVANRANTLFQSGTAPANAFNFSTQVPLQFQNTGPSPSDIPLFTVPNSSKNQNQPV